MRLEKRGEAEEGEEAHDIGDGRQENARGLRGIEAQTLHAKRNDRAREAGADHIDDHREAEDEAHPRVAVPEPGAECRDDADRP